MSLTRSQRFTFSGFSLIFLLALAHGTNDAFATILPVLLPSLQARFGLGEATLAGFVAVISFSSNVLQPLMGALSDRWGKRRMAALGLIVGSILMSFVAVVPSVPLLTLLLAVGGLGSAIFHPAAVSMAHAVGRRKGLSIGLFTSGGPLGSALGPIIVLFVIERFGAGLVPYLSLAGILLGVLLFAFTPKQVQAQGKDRPKLFDAQLFFGPVGLLAVSGILRATAFISFTSAIPLWLVNVGGYASTAPIIGYTLGIYSAFASIGVLVAGALEHYISRRILIVSSMLLGLPLLLGVFAVPTGSLWFYVLVALSGFCVNSSIPLLVVSAQDLAPHALATASGMLMGFTWGTAGVLYIGFGALQQSIGLTQAMSLSYFFLIPAAVLALYVLKPK